jgi:hypothetical protein
MEAKPPTHLNHAQPVMEKVPLPVLPVAAMVHTLAGVAAVRATRLAQTVVRHPVPYVMAVEKQVVRGVTVMVRLHAAGAAEAGGSINWWDEYFFHAGYVFGMLSIQPFLKPVHPFAAYHGIGC